MDIFWIENGKRNGPLPVVEIISQIQLGQLSEETKGWHEGCPSWLPLRELPALEDYFAEYPENETAFPEEEPEHAPGAFVKVVIVPPPWIRLIARILDILIVTFVISLAVPLFDIEFNEYYITAGSLLMLVPLMLYDSILINRFGTTPGKALLNISVLQVGEQKPKFRVSLVRSIYVYILGCGLLSFPFLPILSLFSWYLTRKNGLAPWDIKLKLATFVAAKITMVRMLTCCWLSVILFFGISTNIASWDSGIQNMLKGNQADMEEAVTRFQEEIK